jgi:hypothetical protein
LSSTAFPDKAEGSGMNLQLSLFQRSSVSKQGFVSAKQFAADPKDLSAVDLADDAFWL